MPRSWCRSPRWPWQPPGSCVRRPPRRTAWLLLVAGLAAFALGDLRRPDDLDPAGARACRRGLPGGVPAPGGRPAPHAPAGGPAPWTGPGWSTPRSSAPPRRSATGSSWSGRGIDQGSWPTRAGSVAYLVLDVALLAVATRLVAPGPTRAVPSLLALGVAAILATDVVYALRPRRRPGRPVRPAAPRLAARRRTARRCGDPPRRCAARSRPRRTATRPCPACG